MKIIVVGSAPTAKGLSLGELIDSYDVVIRCNTHTDEQVKDYGKKVDVLAVNLPEHYLEFFEWHTKNRAFNPVQNVDWLWLIGNQFPRQKTLDKLQAIYNPGKITNETINSVKFSVDTKLLCGVRAISAAHAIYGRSVDVVGLTSSEEQASGAYTHYWDQSVSHLTASAKQRLPYQIRALQKMKKQNIIRKILDA